MLLGCSGQMTLDFSTFCRKPETYCRNDPLQYPLLFHGDNCCRSGRSSTEFDSETLPTLSIIIMPKSPQPLLLSSMQISLYSSVNMVFWCMPLFKIWVSSCVQCFKPLHKTFMACSKANADKYAAPIVLESMMAIQDIISPFTHMSSGRYRTQLYDVRTCAWGYFAYVNFCP